MQTGNTQRYTHDDMIRHQGWFPTGTDERIPTRRFTVPFEDSAMPAIRDREVRESPARLRSRLAFDRRIINCHRAEAVHLEYRLIAALQFGNAERCGGRKHH